MTAARTVNVVLAALGVPVLACGVAAPAAAEFDPTVEQAVVAARAVSSCAALRYDPRLEQAAHVVNRSTYEYVNHTAENVPADELHPVAIVNDMGVTATTVRSLQGAGHEFGDAVQGLLLQGYQTLPDCAFTDFGVDHLYEEQTGRHLVVVIMAGN